MAIKLNLQKVEEAKSAIKLNLQKVGIITPPQVDLKFVLDVSGSFEDEHLDGITNDLLTRLVPWGLTFDPDGKLDLSVFSDGPNSVQNVGPVTLENYEDFVKKNIVRKVRGWNGGTDYSYALEEALQSFGWLPTEQATRVEKVGFFGKLLGKKDKVITESSSGEKKKSLVIFVTDGANNDQARTHRVLRESEERGDGVYFLFLGVSNGGGSFDYLKEVDKTYANTAFYEVKNIRSFVQLSDQDLYGELMQEELLNWMKA